MCDEQLKVEIVRVFEANYRRYGPWRGIDDVELATLEYLDWFNHRRLHSACGDLPPVEFEAIHYRHPQSAATGAET